jgi:hypothetical protein
VIVDGLEFIEASKTAAQALHMWPQRDRDRRRQHGRRLRHHRQAARRGARDHGLSPHRSRDDLLRARVRLCSQGRASSSAFSRSLRGCCSDGRLPSASNVCAWSWAAGCLRPPRAAAVAGLRICAPRTRSSKPSASRSPRSQNCWGSKQAKGFIAVDESFQTSMAGVYAIGDCIRARARLPP